jgi:hypothetical protein
MSKAPFKIAVIQEAVRILYQDIPEIEHPEWLVSLAEHIPADEPRARRDVFRFLSLLKAIALCQRFSDGRKTVGNRITILPSDYCIAWEILHDAFASTYRAVHPRVLQVAQAVKTLNENQKRAVSVAELSRQLSWKQPVVYKWVKASLLERLIRYEDETQPHNLKRLLPGPAPSSDFLPHPTAIFQAAQNVEDVCYVDPMTGKEIVLGFRAWKENAE